MGVLFSKCLKRKKDENARRMTAVAPNQLDDSLLEYEEEVDEFYCIPNEHIIDETITHLDELSKLDEKGIAKLNETIGDLNALLNKYQPGLRGSYYSQADRIGSSYMPPTQLADLVKSGSHMESPLSAQLLISNGQSHNSRSHSQLRSDTKASKTTSSKSTASLPAIQEKQKPNLKIEIQSAKFFHEVLLEKHSLSKPYVLIKIYLKPYVKMDSSAPSTSSQIKKFKTSKGSDDMKPSWNEFFGFPLDLPEEKKEKEKKLGMYSAGISLYYSGVDGKPDWQAGQEQHFSLISLMNQNLQRIAIDFRDQDLKGILAKLQLKLQVIHDPKTIKDHIAQEIEVRLEKLTRIRDKHLMPSNYRESYDINSHTLGYNQSMMSVYSMPGNKDGGYFMAL